MRKIDRLRADMAAGLAAAERKGRAAGLHEAANIVDEFAWVLPVYDNPDDNEKSDDTAFAVTGQIATTLRAHAKASENGRP